MTLLLAAFIHGSWLLCTYFATALPWWAAAALGGFLVAWHGSLQHETIHGHPTRSRAFNTLVGSLPLGLWLPYGIYREQHLAHHGASLTDPLDDPESFYVTPVVWARAGRLHRTWLRMQTTAAGRLVLGPPTVVARFVATELARVASGNYTHLRAWAQHAVGLAVVGLWVVRVCHLPLAHYILFFAYPGLALTMVRSFAEHRPAADHAHRIGIVEAGPLARLLYMNNNFHAVHHDAPAVPWYALPACYQAQRSDILASNGNFVFPSYARILTRYAFRSKDSPVHPG